MMKKYCYILFMFMVSYANYAWGQSDSVGFHSTDFLYERYAPHNDWTVAQIVGYQVDTNVFVDAVMLTADDSAAWENLLREFSVPHPCLINDYSSNQIKTVSIIHRQKDNPELNISDVKIGESCILAISYDTKTIWLFSYQNEKESSIIIKKILNKYIVK